MKYAYGLMNQENVTRQSIALSAGYSVSSSKCPKNIERKYGVKIAMSMLASEMQNVSLSLLFELQARDLSKMDNRTLLHSLEVISRTHDRFASKI